MNISTLFILALTTIPLRNPFWPIGYKGEREVISEKPRIAVAAPGETASEEDTKTSITAETLAAAAEADISESQYENRLWIAARKTLTIGATLTVGERQAVSINGRIYGDGDLISANHEGRRFTWRVKNLTGHRTLKLQRVRSRILEEETKGKEETK